MDGKSIKHALWVQVRKRGFSICVPPKCGSTALSILLGVGGGSHGRIGERYEMFTPNEAAKDPWISTHSRYLVIRDPVDRFASAWRDRVRDWGESPKMKRRTDSRYMYSGMSPEELLGFLAKCPFYDIHFYPQYFWLIPSCHFIKSEEFAETLFDESPRARETVVHDNDPPMPHDQIAEFYSADMEMYRRC